MGFYYDDYSRKRRVFPTVLLVVVSALIGGLLSLSLAPLVYGPDFAQPRLQGQEGKVAPLPPSSADYSPVVAIAQRVGPAVVGISNQTGGRTFFSREPVEQGSGSGVIISEDGYIVTNYHVIANAARLIVSLPDGRQLEAEVRGSDAETDLAVLKIKAKNLPVAVLGDSNKLQVGELVVAIGNPLGAEFAGSVTQGVVSAKERYITIQERKVRLIQTDAAINPGNSGGALVNSRGEVIGINSAKLIIQGVEGMGFAIPISDAKPIIEELIEKRYISRPALGIWGVAIDKNAAQQNKMAAGIYIQEPISGGAAEKAGLKAGDIIISIDKEEVTTFDELNEVLNKHKPGDSVQLVLDRNGKRFTTTLVLGERGRQ